LSYKSAEKFVSMASKYYTIIMQTKILTMCPRTETTKTRIEQMH